MEKSRLKIKTKRRRINLKKVILFLLIMFLLYSLIMEIISSKIKNIYVLNNKIVPDVDVLNDLGIIDYPPFYEALNVKKRLSNEYIKDIVIKRKIFNKLYIEVYEYKPIAIYNDKVLLDNGSLLDNIYNIDYIPYILDDISSVYDNFVSAFLKVDDNILYRISEIKPAFTDVDSERFLLYMIDGNSVYITLSRITKLNKYDSILQKIGEKRGIVYLDSGDYIEIKD